MTIITDDMIIKNVISPALVVGTATDYSYTCIFILPSSSIMVSISGSKTIAAIKTNTNKAV